MTKSKHTQAYTKGLKINVHGCSQRAITMAEAGIAAFAKKNETEGITASLDQISIGSSSPIRSYPHRLRLIQSPRPVLPRSDLNATPQLDKAVKEALIRNTPRSKFPQRRKPPQLEVRKCAFGWEEVRAMKFKTKLDFYSQLSN